MGAIKMVDKGMLCSSIAFMLPSVLAVPPYLAIQPSPAPVSGAVSSLPVATDKLDAHIPVNNPYEEGWSCHPYCKEAPMQFWGINREVASHGSSEPGHILLSGLQCHHPMQSAKHRPVPQMLLPLPRPAQPCTTPLPTGNSGGTSDTRWRQTV